MIAEDTTPELNDAWGSEVHKFVVSVFRARLLVMILLVAALLVFLAFEPVGWKLVWISVTVALTAVLGLYEYRRVLRTPPGLATIQLNLVGMFLIQTSMVFVTGGIESPMLLVYVPFGVIAGLSLGRLRRVAPVIAVPVLLTVLFAAGAQGGWLPRTTPSFFQLGAGFADKPIYVWTKAGVLVFLISATAAVGGMMRSTLEGITRQVALQRRDMLDTLMGRNREILSVASTVAHELKNPLASIQGLAQLMARSVPQGKDAERLEVMRREIARMGNVLDEFRTFSRPLSGLSLSRARLRQLIDDVVQLNEARAEAKGIRLQLVPGDDVLTVCDPQKIKQALLNLVQNALDATPQGGKVEVRVKIVDTTEALVEVTDSGEGIAPEIADRLFTAGATTKKHGSGIGLVVAKSIAEQHGGRVTLENEAKRGCRAVLQLPIKAALPAEDAL
jgi:signal transduction histidine kinase